MRADNDYQYILSLSETGSMSAAARRLNVNHTTVARRIHSFEERFNVRLFERVAKGYRLTDVGRSVLADIQMLNEHQLNLERKLVGQDQQLAGDVTLALTPEVAEHYVVPELSLFQEYYPHIQLNLVMGSVHKNLHGREADIALRFTPAPTQPDLVGRCLFRSNWGIYASKSYLSEDRSVHRILEWALESDAQWYQAHFSSFRKVMKFDQLGPLVTACEGGLGVAKLPCAFADKGGRDLYRLDLSVKPSEWQLWLLYHSDLRATAKIAAVKDYLLQKLPAYQAYFEGNRSRYWQND